ncbi:hypothetical protein D3C81_1691930 [compost metagenome]
MHVKNVNVTNPKNVLVQIPGFIASKWGLNQDSKLEVLYNEESQSVVIRPRALSVRRNVNLKGKRLARLSR